MSLYKVGATWYIYITHQGERIRQSTGTADKRRAQQIHDQLKAELWQRRAAGHTWHDAIRLWLDEAPRDEADRYRLRALGIGDIPLERIDAPLIEEKLAGKRAANYQRYRNLILAVLNGARRAGWIEQAPKPASKKPPAGRIRWLTRKEWDTLYRHLPAHLQPLALFAVATGLRQKNVTHLEWSQVDLKRRVAWIHPDQAKSRKALGIPLSDEAIAVLTAQEAVCRGDGDDPGKWVFPYRGKPIGKIKTAWAKALQRAGLGEWIGEGEQRKFVTDFRWHDLRHTWASWHIMAGTPLEVLQKLGGWSDIRMVLRYAHLAPEHLAGFANNYATSSRHNRAAA